MISTTKSSGRSDPSGVHQVAIQGPALLNLLISDEDDGADCTLSKFADETNLGEMADKPGACALMQGGTWTGWRNEPYEVQEGEVQSPSHREQ